MTVKEHHNLKIGDMIQYNMYDNVVYYLLVIAIDKQVKVETLNNEPNILSSFFITPIESSSHKFKLL